MAIIDSIKLSQFEFVNRIDAELYNPIYKKSFNELLNSHLKLYKLKELCVIRSGSTPSDRDDNLSNGPILLKTTDIRNNVICPYGDFYHISQMIFDRMRSTKLSDNDVLFNIVGATLDVIGRSGFILNFIKANITQAMVLLRCKNNKIRPGYLFAYLNTYYAQDQVKRYARPTGQYNLNLKEVGHIAIPLLETIYQKEIESYVLNASQELNQSFELYTQAQQLLDQELGLGKLKFEKPVGYKVRFSEVVSSNRLDAQHFQFKFKQLITQIKKYNLKHIRDIRSYNRRGVQPVYIANGNIDVVNSQHIGKKHLDYSNFQKTDESIFNTFLGFSTNLLI